MKPVLRTAFAAFTLTVTAALPVFAQNLFETIITVNDQAITRYELDQRARMLTLFRTPGDPVKLARKQLIEDRLRIHAANANGVRLEEDVVLSGMEDFAQRANIGREEMVQGLESNGISESTFREFVRAGITWRELVRARFASRISVNEADLERARMATSESSGVRVLLSEIILAAPPERQEEAQQRATIIAELSTFGAFAEQARKYSASGSRDIGGRLEWLSLSDLPPAIRGSILGLAPGEVTDPLPGDGAIALFQLRDIEEVIAPQPEYAAIEYAAYYIDGGRSEIALKRAAHISATTDTCDDLYGVAHGQPETVLERGSKAPDEIPQDIAIELAKLDPGETSANLTRANGQTLVVLMLCGRSPQVEGEGPSTQGLTNFVRNSRLDSFASGYLEQLRSEARIVEIK